jgi:hypothetical protein
MGLLLTDTTWYTYFNGGKNVHITPEHSVQLRSEFFYT